MRCFFTNGELRIVPLEHWSNAGMGKFEDALVYDPSPRKRYDRETHSFRDDVDGVCASMIAALKQRRDLAIAGGCMTPLGRVQTDSASLAAITRFAAAADRAQRRGEDFGVVWIMADNSHVQHDAIAMIALDHAVTVGITALRSVYNGFREALNAAVSLDELDAAFAAIS